MKKLLLVDVPEDQDSGRYIKTLGVTLHVLFNNYPVRMTGIDFKELHIPTEEEINNIIESNLNCIQNEAFCNLSAAQEIINKLLNQ